MLDDLKHLVDAGFAVIPLHEKSKKPVGDDWTSKPVYSFEELSRRMGARQNGGVRLGEPSRVGDLYLNVLDVDIRDPALIDEARAKLLELAPEVDTLPTVISGSGGASRHYYFLTDAPFRSRKLAHSSTKVLGQDGKEHWGFEIELFGTGKQVVLPPSIHPNGQAYVWGREFDFDLVDMGLGPIISSERIRSWIGGADLGPRAADEDDDDLGAVLHKAPMDLTREQIDSTLAALPLPDWCDDRDGWLQVGMALHHQFGGAAEGLKLWNTFSAQSKKYDERDQGRVWKSFDVSSKSLRFAILIKAAAEARMRADLAGDDDDFDAQFDAEDEEDLIGLAPAVAGDDDEDLIGGAPAKTKVDWVIKLDRNDEGALKSHLHNGKLIIGNDTRLIRVHACNEFVNEVVQRGPPGRKTMQKASPKGVVQLEGPIWQLKDPVNGDLWTDAHDDAVRAMIEAPTRQGGYGIKISDRDLTAAINIVARENSFHPVKEYLESLTWDGVPRVDQVFVKYMGSPDTIYTRSVARMMFVAGVARIYKPGHKFDFATIIEGSQGKGKSTFIRILGKNWSSELDGKFHDPKEMVEAMQGSWVLEMPELNGFNKSEVASIKAFISRTSDKTRLAYGRRAGVYPRQNILVGSTNDRKYLKDSTGGRRFWPIECLVAEIDTEGFAAEIDQYWAEAFVIHNQMREKHGWASDLPLYLTDAAAATEAKRLQEDRRVETPEDAIVGSVVEWLDGPLTDPNGFEDEGDVIGGAVRNETCLLQIWVECLGRDKASYMSNPATAQMLGRVMKLVAGWAPAKMPRRIGKYGLTRFYQRLTN